MYVHQKKNLLHFDLEVELYYTTIAIATITTRTTTITASTTTTIEHINSSI